MVFKGIAIAVTLLDGVIAEINFDLQGESVNKFDARSVDVLEQAFAALACRERVL